MKKWTDKHIKRHIEELIEESYILSLSPADLERYLHDFIQASEAVLRRGPQAVGDVRITRLRIALLRANLLENDIRAASGHEKNLTNGKDAGVTLQEKAIRTKRLIMMLLEEIDHHIATQVVSESKKRADIAAGRSQRMEKIKSIAVALGYYSMLAMTLILFWIVLSY